MQIQISGCTSNCQGVSQVQQAAQTASTVQSVGSAAQQASALEPSPGPSSSAQVTNTITQIQLGCLSACFGTTTTGAATAALTQLVLSELSGLVPPSGSSDLQPVPATVQNAVQQIACQIQGTGASGTQAQSASQTSATVQIVSSLPVDLGSTGAASAPGAVGQTQQRTWQLQIGCLFYCVDSQQVQQAQQTATTVEIGDGTTVTVVQQSIWQFQVGCLAWCWDSTQLQIASTQTTIVVGTSPTGGQGPPPTPAPAPPPVAPSAPPDPAPTSSSQPTEAAVGSGPPAVGPPSAPPTPTVTVRLLGSPRALGLAIIERRPVAAVAVRTRPLATLPVSASAPSAGVGEPVAVPAVLHRPSAEPRPARSVSSSPRPAATITPEHVVADASGEGGAPVLALLLAVSAALALAAVVRRRSTRAGRH